MTRVGKLPLYVVALLAVITAPADARPSPVDRELRVAVSRDLITGSDADDAMRLLPRVGRRLPALRQDIIVLARQRRLAARARIAVRTLRVNASAPAGRTGERRIFGDPLIWQWYPRQGWQVQVLANSGRLAALRSTRQTEEFARHLRLLSDLAVDTPAGPRVEYLFSYRGAAGWSSAFTSANLLASVATQRRRDPDRRWARLERGLRADVARLQRKDGFFPLYGQSPRFTVFNGHAGALIGLARHRELEPDDDRVRGLLDDGKRWLVRRLARMDTGTWSLYSPGKESDLGYHDLLTGQLRTLCTLLDEKRFCAQADRFDAYKEQPVRISGVRVSRGTGVWTVRMRLSKISDVTVSGWYRGRTKRIVRGRYFRGPETIALRVDGRLDRVKIEARSLTGQSTIRDVALGS